jgi:hypothetical protein
MYNLIIEYIKEYEKEKIITLVKKKNISLNKEIWIKEVKKLQADISKDWYIDDRNLKKYIKSEKEKNNYLLTIKIYYNSNLEQISSYSSWKIYIDKYEIEKNKKYKDILSKNIVENIKKKIFDTEWIVKIPCY